MSAALAIDASSPATAKQSTAAGSTTVTTVSFTPPASSLLVVMWTGDSNPSGANPSQPTVTDSLGVHLNYTLANWSNQADAPSGAGGQAAIWTAPVTASAAMTISVTTIPGSASYNDATLRVVVITAGGSQPAVGASAKKSVATAATTVSTGYTATATGSWGFGIGYDWNFTGVPTAGTGCATIDAAVVSGDQAYWYGRRATADGVLGATTTLTFSPAASTTALHMVVVEVVPPATATATAAADLTGSGTLAATTTPKATQTAPLTGSGTLTASSSTSSGGQVALVNQTASTITTGNPRSLTIPALTPGNLLVTFVSIQSTTITVSAITDNGGGTWTRAVGLLASAGVEMWYRATATGSPTTVTVTTSTSATTTVMVSEWSGINLATAPVTASVTTAASPNTAGVETPVAPGDLVIGGFAVGSATARTISVGTELTKPTLPGSFNTAAGYVVAPDTSPTNISWTTTSTASTAGVSALFRASAASAPIGTASADLTSSGALTATVIPKLVASASSAGSGTLAANSPSAASYRRGVASSGGEFGTTALPGTYGADYHYDSAASLTYLASRGHKTVRFAFLWERLQRTLGGALDAGEVARITTYINNAGAAGLGVILDLHNYARYQGLALNAVGGPSVANLVDLWTRISAQWGSNPAVVAYGIMNEPHDLVGGWANATLYEGFESGLSAWKVEGTNTAAISTTQAHQGTQSIVGTKAITAAGSGQAIRFNDGMGATTRALSGPSLSAWVYVPATTGMSGATATLQVQDSAFAFQIGPTVNIPTDKWTQVTYTPSASVLASARAIVVSVGSNWSTTGTFTAYVDQIEQGTAQAAAQQWETASQSVVTALRNAGDNKIVFVPGYNWSGVHSWASSHPVGWITDPANNFRYEGHHYWDGDHSGTYAASYAAEVTTASSAGYTAGANPDALTTRTLTEIDNWTTWLTNNNAKGFVGEFGWPQGNADATAWNALASAWYTHADTAGLWASQWSTSEWFGTYLLSVYTGSPLSTPTTSAAICEAHPSQGITNAVIVNAALTGSGALSANVASPLVLTARALLSGSGALSAVWAGAPILPKSTFYRIVAGAWTAATVQRL